MLTLTDDESLSKALSTIDTSEMTFDSNKLNNVNLLGREPTKLEIDQLEEEVVRAEVELSKEERQGAFERKMDDPYARICSMLIYEPMDRANEKATAIEIESAKRDLIPAVASVNFVALDFSRKGRDCAEGNVQFKEARRYFANPVLVASLAGTEAKLLSSAIAKNRELVTSYIECVNSISIRDIEAMRDIYAEIVEGWQPRIEALHGSIDYMGQEVTRFTELDRRLRDGKLKPNQHNQLLQMEKLSLGLDKGEVLEILLERMQEAQHHYSTFMTSRQKFILHNLRLGFSLAKKQIWKAKTHSYLDIEDLMSAAIVGLMTAVEKFDHRRGYKFSTYATWWIRQSVGRDISNTGTGIRKPVHHIEFMYKVSKAKKELIDEHGSHYKPSVDEIAVKMDVDVSYVQKHLSNATTTVSYQTPMGDDSDGMTIGDMIADKKQDPASDVHNSLLNEQLKDVMSTLSPREQSVLDYRFGLTEGYGRTLEEIGQMFNVTRERIRQIEAKALKKMRHPTRARKFDPGMLKEYLD